MALHTELPIYKVAYDLLTIAIDYAQNMPRAVKAVIGGRLRDLCLELVLLIAKANDFVLLHESPQWLNEAHERIETFLPPALKLHLNPTKTILQPIERGIDFAGQVIKPWRHILRRRTVNDALHRIEHMPAADLLESGNSYFGLLRQATHSHHDRTRLAGILHERGHRVNPALTKIYRRSV